MLKTKQEEYYAGKLLEGDIKNCRLETVCKLIQKMADVISELQSSNKDSDNH